MAFDLMSSRILLDEPHRLTDIDAWHEHIPFAFLLVELQEPDVLVELGTLRGDSYCAFCQAVASLSLSTRCYAVDSWEGDSHTGPYTAEVYEGLREYHDELYGSFSQLLRSTFDQAVPHFSDASIDLLHIDGDHSYASVTNDFATWRPKLSPRAVVLLHDTHVREEGYGVWRLWEELAPRYPSFAFEHSHGLGVLAVGETPDPRVLEFLEFSVQRPQEVQALFSSLGSLAALRGRAHRLGLHAAVLEQQLDESRRNVNRLQQEVAAARAELSDLYSSRSWRITAPLRELRRHVLPISRRVRRRIRDGAQLPTTTSFSPYAAGARAGRGTRAEESAALNSELLVSVLMPVFDPPVELLQGAIDSVKAQRYANWELCICDDGSRSAEVGSLLLTESLEDTRIQVVRSEANEGISTASNRALRNASGEFVALLDHDDELAPEALLLCVSSLEARPDTDVLYTDEDKIDMDGVVSEPFHKPAWSPNLLRGVMYVGHLLVVRRSLLEKVGGFDSNYDGVQDYELMLRLSERTERIEHLGRTLYHWRKAPGSVALDIDAKDAVPERQIQAVNAHLQRCGVRAQARRHGRIPHRAELHAGPRDDWPAVSVIVSGASGELLDRCLRALFRRTTYPQYEVLVVSNSGGAEDVSGHEVTLLRAEGTESRPQALNRAVASASSEIVILLDREAEVITPDWVQALVWPLELPRVSATGPLLLDPRKRVRSAGLVFGEDGSFEDAHAGASAQADGHAGSLSCMREVSAVRAECMAINRQALVSVGGFGEDYRACHFDGDLCLRLSEAGHSVLFTPRATVVVHATGRHRHDPLDAAVLADVWSGFVASGDPFSSAHSRGRLRNKETSTIAA